MVLFKHQTLHTYLVRQHYNIVEHDDGIAARILSGDTGDNSDKYQNFIDVDSGGGFKNEYLEMLKEVSSNDSPPI
jgi:hypothetical protein